MPQPKYGDPNEPMISFQSAIHKVEWAERQFSDFNNAIENVLKRYKETGGISFDHKTGTSSLGTLSISPFFACWAGDIIFSLRSALDCCWMGLLRAINSNAPKGTLPRGEVKDVEAGIDKSGVKNVFPNISNLLLKDLKAYNGGNETLWFVAQVDNWNKHNMLVIVFQTINAKDAEMNFPNGLKIRLIDSEIVGMPDNNAFVVPGAGQAHWKKGSDISFDVILNLKKPADERLLLPFLKKAVSDTKIGVHGFANGYAKRLQI